MPATSNAHHEMVSAYTKAGFTVFNCNKKVPAKGVQWSAVPYNPDLLPEEISDSFGVRLSHDVFVIDVDVRRFENNEDQLVLLWYQLGLSNPNTFIVATPGGGTHIYFRKPKDLKIKSNKQMKALGFGALELKTQDSYVIGCGSRYYSADAADFVEYKLLQGSPLDIAPAPDVLLNFIERDVIEPYFGFKETLSESQATRSRFIQYCNTTAPAIEGQGGNETTYNVALIGLDFGLVMTDTLDIMHGYYNHRCEPEWSDGELEKIVANAYSYAKNSIGNRHPSSEFASPTSAIKEQIEAALAARNKYTGNYDFDEAVNSKGSVIGLKPTVRNVVQFMRLPNLNGKPNPLKNLVRYNMFSNEYEFARFAPWHIEADKPKYWTDSDTLGLKMYLNETYRFIVGTDTIDEGVQIAARAIRTHPPREWATSLLWDGIPRLDNWLTTYCGAKDTAYTREVAKNTFIAMIARIMEPGCKHDHILVLQGKQGIGKSSIVAAIGGPFYLDVHLDMNNIRDASGLLEGGWVIELAEMEFTRQAHYSTMKAFITRQEDKVRPAYQKRFVTKPRQSVMIGTFNPSDHLTYMKDVTGNRRFWPVDVTKADIAALKRDRVQLFAEAKTRYLQGESWHLTGIAAMRQAEALQNESINRDDWDELIQEWLDRQWKNATDYTIKGFTVIDVAQKAIGIPYAQFNGSINVRIIRILKRLGYVLRLRGKAKRWVIDPDLYNGVS